MGRRQQLTAGRTILGVNSVCVLASLLSPGPLPPPPPISRNGSTSRALPAAPQLPSRAGLENQRGGTRPPLPPDRPGSGALPPPPPPSSALRNGFQDPGDGKPCSQLLAFGRKCVVAFGLNTAKKVWGRGLVPKASFEFLVRRGIVWVLINPAGYEWSK